VPVGCETASGARSDRAQLKRAVAALVEGDVLLVTRLDRLARSTRDLLNVLAAIGEQGVAFRSLRDAWADTTTAHGRLMLTVAGAATRRRCQHLPARGGQIRFAADEKSEQRLPLLLGVF
jgi:DNA invertase Pin-like site-specific DNA recombinase